MNYLYIVAAALCWSSGGVFLKFVDADIGVISCIRCWVGLAALMLLCRSLPVFTIRNADKTINKNDTLLLWLGGITFAACSTLYVCANRYTTAANAILLQYTNPIWIIIFAPKLLKEKNSKVDFISIAGVISGMILFFASELLKGFENIDKKMLLGDLFAILSGFCLAFYTMLMRRQKNGGSLESSILSQLIAAVIFTPFLFKAGLPSDKSILFLVLCGLINGALALFFYTKGLKKISALSASLISMLEPLTNPVWVLIFAGEKPTLICITGGVIILGFVIFRTIYTAKKNMEANLC